MEMSPSFRDMQLEILKQDLEKLKKDYKDLADKKRREDNPPNKNNLQLELDSINKEMEKVDKQINNLEQKVKNEKFKKLQQILSQFTKEEISIVKQAYQACSPDGWIHISTNKPEEILVDVLKMSKGDSDYTRVERFVACLITLVKNNTSLVSSLNKLAEENIDKFEDLLNQEKEKLEESRKNKNSYLLLVLEKSNQDSASKNSDCYRIQAWFISDIENYKYHHKNKSCDGCEQLDCPEISNKTFTINEIQTKVLKFLIDKCLEYEFLDLNIEIFLPLNLLNYNVEWWEIKEELDLGYRTFIGKDYKVVVRSYERCTKSYDRLRVSWVNKWNTLFKKFKNTCRDSIYLEVDEQTVEYKLINSAEEIVGVRVVKSPKKIGPGSIFAALVKTGTPVALWLRNNPRSLDYCQSEIDEILGNCCIEELPDAVRKKRKCADPNVETHIGNHISLLWEDPYRLPPEINYSM